MKNLVAGVYPHPFDVGRHDASVSLLTFDQQSQQISDVFAYEEAKCNSEKGFGSGPFPDRSLFLGLKHFKARPSDVSTWVFPKPPPEIGTQHLVRFFKMLGVLEGDALSSDLEAMVSCGTVRLFPHHMLHAGVASFTSPFSRGSFCTLDGGGDGGDPTDFSFGTFSEGGGLKVKLTHQPEGPNITRFHDRITELLGFGYDENGKTNGIAAYGQPLADLKDYFFSRQSRDAHGFPIYSFQRHERTPVAPERIRLDSYSKEKILFPAPGFLQMGQDLLKFSPYDIAAAAEAHFSDEIYRLILRHLDSSGHRRAGDEQNVAFSGGAFNNVTLNGRIAENSHFKSHFSMSPGDSGLSLGGALLVASESGCKNWRSPLVGPQFSEDEVDALLEEMEITAGPSRGKDAAVEAVQKGAIVGIFDGRAEFGPRSLGSRSIVGDPRIPESKARVNHRVKRRDFFMPFAPAVLEEFVSVFSEKPGIVNPYMQVVSQVRSEQMADISAAVHVDGSARIQRVEQELFPSFYDFISRFHRLTGVPAVLNTSFNRHGISTISSPRQALEHFLAEYLDGLLIEGRYLWFEDVRGPRSLNGPLHSSEKEELSDWEQAYRTRLGRINNG